MKCSSLHIIWITDPEISFFVEEFQGQPIRLRVGRWFVTLVSKINDIIAKQLVFLFSVEYFSNFFQQFIDKDWGIDARKQHENVHM